MEVKQIKFFRKTIKALDKEINILIVNREHINQVIKNLEKSLMTLSMEVEKEKKLSRQILNFEFGEFFEECKKRRQQVEDEIKRNKVIVEDLILELKEKFNKQKKYEILLSKIEEKVKTQNKLNEQKRLDELIQQRYI